MADSGVPFPVDASNVALVENLTSLPTGQPARIDILITGLRGVEPVTLVFTAKVTPATPDDDPSTITKTVTQTPSDDGVIAATSDATIWRATVDLTADDVDTISEESTYSYSAVATLDSETERMVQTGAIAAQAYG